MASSEEQGKGRYNTYKPKEQGRKPVGPRNLPEGCWECGELDHIRSACPKLKAKQANHAKVTCVRYKQPYLCTVSGTVGDKTVSRILVDSGADISIIADDLLPADTRREQPIAVEGVGKNTKLYDTAQVPVTIEGKTKLVQMAIAPIADIPYGVILGTNIPETELSWKWQRQHDEPTAVFNHSAGNHTQATGGAGERVSQVARENAISPEPETEQPEAAQQEQIDGDTNLMTNPATAAVVTRRQEAVNSQSEPPINMLSRK